MVEHPSSRPVDRHVSRPFLESSSSQYLDWLVISTALQAKDALSHATVAYFFHPNGGQSMETCKDILHVSAIQLENDCSHVSLSFFLVFSHSQPAFFVSGLRLGLRLGFGF